jgi:hypothetical protein
MLRSLWPLSFMKRRNTAVALPAIASMVARYDASILTGSSGANITPWPDSFGSFNATEVLAGLGGRLQLADIGGLNSLWFSANRGYSVSTSILNGASAASYIAVYYKDLDPPSATEGAIVDGFGSTGSATHHPFSDGIIYDGFGTTARKTVGNPTPSLASPRIYCVRSATNDFTAHLDGTLLFSTATNTVGINGTGVGSRYIGRNTSVELAGKIGELVIFNAALSSTDREKMEGYLAWKWGLVSNLPGGHPYKSSPP